MVTEKEFLLLSILSYCNFNQSCIDLELEEALDNIRIDEHKWIKFKILSLKTYQEFINFFKEELKNWKILGIYDKRATNKEGKNEKTGFYSISFKKEEDVVIAFRGSEVFPYEEAYKDFVENNLVLGIGKRPKQFDNAIDFYNQHIYKYSIDKKNIHITGHSLGGGISQYIAAYSNKKYGYIPKTITWNSVGVNKKGIFTVEDFITFDEILEKSLTIDKKWFKILDVFRAQYYSLLEAYLDGSKLSLEKYFLDKLKMDIVFNLCLTRITTSLEERAKIKEILVDTFAKSEIVVEGVSKAKLFLNELSENEVYKDRVINYGHSKDITFNVFEHIGVALKVDDDFKVVHSKKMLNLILDKEKFFTYYHYDDVFLPFFSNKKESEGCISCDLEIEYVSSALRYLIYKEDGFSKEILGEYYTIENNKILEYENVKREIILGIKKTKVEILYKEKVKNYIVDLEPEKIKEIWQLLKQRMPSPYLAKDVYDRILY